MPRVHEVEHTHCRTAYTRAVEQIVAALRAGLDEGPGTYDDEAIYIEGVFLLDHGLKDTRIDS